MEKNYETPIGIINIEYNETAVTGIYFDKKTQTPYIENSVILQVQTELDEYFNGTRKVFNVPLKLDGTPFRCDVWNELSKIPYGETVTYAEIATRLGNPKAMRAVGGANNHNPVCIIVPCHRVIGADGSLTGYAGGLHRKKWLLEHEKMFGN